MSTIPDAFWSHYIDCDFKREREREGETTVYSDLKTFLTNISNLRTEKLKKYAEICTRKKKYLRRSNHLLIITRHAV